MPDATETIVGVFAHVDTTVRALEELRAKGYRDLTVYTPVPVHEIEEVLERGRPVSRVRLFALIGGLPGIASAFLLTIWTSLIWGLVTGGKYFQFGPGGIVGSSLPPFVIIAFELMVLFGGIATVIGLVVLGRLPRFRPSATFDPRFTNDRFGIAIHCAPGRSGSVRKISRTEPLRPGAQWMAMPKRSFVNRGSKVALGRNLGNRPSTTRPITVAIPPKRTISSNAMMTNGGSDDPTMPPGPNWKYLPPVTRPQMSEVQIVRRKADAIPVSPPISVKRRTRLTGRSRSRTSSISCTGTGVYTVRSRYPFARSSSSARTVVSTWAKTPTIVSVASGMRRVPHRRRKGLLDFDDRERRHHPDEPEEQDEEPGEAADDDHRVGRARIVDAPGVGVEVVPERRDDDVEALEPHADQDENGHDVQHDRARARLLPEQDQR